MAADKSMTNSAEIVAKALIDEHSDFLKESARLIAQELMEAEIAAQNGARRGEVSEDRSTHRNGYRPRPWDTRVGEIELAVPNRLVSELGIHMSKDQVSRQNLDLWEMPQRGGQTRVEAPVDPDETVRGMVSALAGSGSTTVATVLLSRGR